MATYTIVLNRHFLELNRACVIQLRRWASKIIALIINEFSLHNVALLLSNVSLSLSVWKLQRDRRNGTG